MAKGPRLNAVKQLCYIDPALESSSQFLKFKQSLVQIVKREFRKLGLVYEHYDFDANIRIIIRDMSRNFEPCTIWLEREVGNGTPSYETKPLNDRVKFYYVPNNEIKFEIQLSIWLGENGGHAKQCKNFAYDLEPRIIKAYIKSLPDTRSSRCARYDTVFSILKHHSPIKFETEGELYAYGAKYGFDDEGSDALLRSARLDVNQKGGRI